MSVPTCCDCSNCERDIKAALDAAVAAEREACAKVVEFASLAWEGVDPRAVIATAIRARGDKAVAPTLTLGEAVGQMPSVMVSPAPLAPPYPGTTCDFCGVNVAPFTDPADDPKPVAHVDSPRRDGLKAALREARDAFRGEGDHADAAEAVNAAFAKMFDRRRAKPVGEP